MADNVAITAGTGTTIATDDVGGGVQVQRVKTTWGPDGTANDADVASGKPMPVQLRGSDGTDRSNVLPVSQSGNWSIAVVSTVTGIINALPAGTNIIGRMASNDAVDIGNVDVASVPTDPFGANADAASATGSISAKLRALATALGTSALDLGQGTGGTRTLRVAIDTAQLDGSEYETVAASQTTQTLGGTGATGDYLRSVLVVPANINPGNIQIKDGSAGAITIFAGGATSVSNLVPFSIELGLVSTAGAWQLTTGASVSAIGIGNFT